MAQRNKPRPARVFDFDIGKNIIHVVGMDEWGHPIQKVRFKRDTLLQFFEMASPALIGMESGPGSRWLARKVISSGHQVRLIPVQFVKPYVKTNKNDIVGTGTVAEAVTRPAMWFVATRETDQVDLLPLRLTSCRPLERSCFSGRCAAMSFAMSRAGSPSSLPRPCRAAS
jgi:transposase